MAESKPETVKRVKSEAEQPDGAWVVIDDAKEVQAVERSEVRALRIAVRIKGTVVRWPFGKSRAEVLL